MNYVTDVLENEEKILFALRDLYKSYGYLKYRMSKFEEYDLYVRNKDFLVSDNIITFTDVDGKLMALKPDVTLSIIKNSRDSLGGVQKMYYNEHVYRASSDTRAFKEIMQVGLECIGDIDDYCICEVVSLAAESLKAISEDFILDISHMGIVSSIVDGLGTDEKSRRLILKCLGEKNAQGIAQICTEIGIDEVELEKLKSLVSCYGEPAKVIKSLREMNGDENFEGAVSQLEIIAGVLADNGFGGKVNIDFSVINDMKYYNGVVFKGFVNGVPESVLSGGQYDNLMKKVSRKSGAIGFAVYLDMLERLFDEEKAYDVDNILLYDKGASVSDINAAVKKISENGESVWAQGEVPKKVRYKKLLRLSGKEVETLENNA